MTKKENKNESAGAFIEEKKKKKKPKDKSKNSIPTLSSEGKSIKINYEISGGGEIVNRVIERMNKELSVLKNGSNGSTVLNLSILQCTEGDRWGRICCGELGVGWIVLEIEWNLKDEKGCVLVQGASKLRDSGVVGFSDLCDNYYGEKNLINTLTPKLAEEIKSKSLPFL